MNTQLLQKHLANSLTGLARACEPTQRNDSTDKVVLEVLSSDELDESVLLNHLEKIHKECQIIGACSIDVEINLNEVYGSFDEAQMEKNRLWKGLHNIAVRLCGEGTYSNEPLIEFIYRALQGYGDAHSMKSSLRELDIVEAINQA